MTITMTALLHAETVNNIHYRVVRRPSGNIQIWADYPAGMSAGYAEACYSGSIEGARQAWRQMKQRAAFCH